MLLKKSCKVNKDKFEKKLMSLIVVKRSYKRRQFFFGKLALIKNYGGSIKEKYIDERLNKRIKETVHGAHV
jgi:hypothetical protein